MIFSHPRGQFQGSFVALPTPFRNGAFDRESFGKLIEMHVQNGTAGLVVCGTTGEAATLDAAERAQVLEAALTFARGRLPVVAGVGTNDTRTTVENARAAAQGGAHALLVVTPYYNKPSPRGLVLHFSAVAEAVETPIILYNVPGRTGVDMAPAVVKEVGERFPHVLAVKEALPSLERVKRLVGETPCAVLCGDDASIADFVSHGAIGVVGVANNIAPRETAELVRAARPGGDSKRAAELVEFLAPLARDLFLEPNPVPVKFALARLGRIASDEVRLPLAPLEPATRLAVESMLRACKLL